jgi:hypothetical protein
MKVALCLSGQLRWIEHCYPYIYENLIRPNNADVFVHGWYNEKDVGKAFTDFDSNHIAFKGYLDKDAHLKIIKLYKPKYYLFEKQLEFTEEIKNIEIHKLYGSRPLNVFSMFYSIMKSNDIMSIYSNNINKKYDCVIRARYDLMIENVINLNEYDMDYLHLKGDCKHNSYCINDHFAFSNVENMNKYCDTYNNIGKMYFKNKVDFCPEILLGFSLNYHYNLDHKIQKHNWNNKVKYVY